MSMSLSPRPERFTSTRLPGSKFPGVRQNVGQRMGGFQRGQNAFHAAELLEGRKRFVIVGHAVLHASHGRKMGVFRAHAGVVQSRGNGAGRQNLPVVVLKQHGVLAVQHAGGVRD